MQTACYVLIGLLLAGYAILGWLHLGAGALHPLLARDEADRQSLRSCAGGAWDGKEAWLVAAGALFYAAFPSAGSLVLRAFAPLLALVLVALVVRAVARRVLARGTAAERFWSRTLVLGSAMPIFLFGVMAGNLVRGLPLAFVTPATASAAGLDGHAVYTESILALLNPYALLMGLVALVAAARHAAAWAALTATGTLKLRARRAHFVGQWVFLGAVVAGAAGTAFAAPQQFQTTLESAAGLMAIAALVLSLTVERLSRVRGSDAGAFLGSAASLAALLGLWAAGSYPVLVRSLSSDVPDLTATTSTTGPTPTAAMVASAVALVVLALWAAFRRPRR